MSSIIQQIYSGIVTRGRRNAPTYNEVRRDSTKVFNIEAEALIDLRI